jgi:hypothetical protein
VSYPTTNGSQPAAAGAAPGAESTAAIGGMPGLGEPAAVRTPVPAPQPSFMASVLRLFAWLSVVSLLMWAVVYSVRKFRRLRAAPNYSFERS